MAEHAEAIAPERVVCCADSFILGDAILPPGGVCTSLPDMAELGLAPAAYAEWFGRAVDLCLALSRGRQAGAPTVFYQTDRLHGGRWHSKLAALIAAADEPPLWHKIILRREPGHADFHRPTFAHLVAFGSCRPGRRTADVLPASPPIWRNGPPRSAAILAASFVAARADALIDPFCGRGSFLAAANTIGLPAYGIDIDPAACDEARLLQL
jgi:hypothetical protein